MTKKAEMPEEIIEPMEGTFGERLARLLNYLIRNPSVVPAYSVFLAKHFRRIPPIRQELPWISYTAIQKLRRFLRPEHEVAEFGGGGSTIFFAQRAKSVVCVESHEAWGEEIRRELAKKNLDGKVSIEVHPFDPSDYEGFLASPYRNALGDRQFDVILVDGYEEKIKLRPSCFEMAERHVKPGGCIVVDDSWRYPHIRKNNRAKSWKEYRCIGPLPFRGHDHGHLLLLGAPGNPA